MSASRPGSLTKVGDAEPSHRVDRRRRKAAAPDEDQVGARGADALQVDAVRARHARQALGRLGEVGEVGGADDQVAGADGEELFRQVRSEADDAARGLGEFDGAAFVVDHRDSRVSRAGERERDDQRERAHRYLAAAGSAGSVTKPIFARPACCAVDSTNAMRS